MWAIWCTRNDLIFEEKKTGYLFVGYFQEGHIGCDFDSYCNMRNQGRLSDWQIKR